MRDTLDKGSFIQMFDFPYPQSLVDENGFFTGQIIATLVTKSLIDDKQASAPTTRALTESADLAIRLFGS